jgi:N-acetylmuramoyl-L-alanine amidase
MRIDAKLILLSFFLASLTGLDAAATSDFRLTTGRHTPTMIVIDPGHGGADEGVRGPAGKLEKALMLELARKIKARLVPDLEVRLTRDDDYQVSLTDRTAVANTSRAALLVSLHAGASFTPNAENTTTIYLYEPPPSDAPIETAVGDQPLSEWQWRHQQRRHLKESQRLAKNIARQLGRLTAVPAVTTQKACLPVLAGADLPAVLLEFGALSSVAGEKRLAGAQWQQNTADAIAEAVRLFISTASQ